LLHRHLWKGAQRKYHKQIRRSINSTTTRTDEICLDIDSNYNRYVPCVSGNLLIGCSLATPPPSQAIWIELRARLLCALSVLARYSDIPYIYLGHDRFVQLHNEIMSHVPRYSQLYQSLECRSHIIGHSA